MEKVLVKYSEYSYSNKNPNNDELIEALQTEVEFYKVCFDITVATMCV